MNVVDNKNTITDLQSHGNPDVHIVFVNIYLKINIKFLVTYLLVIS